jgi:nucleoside recognition membrane protein YjiH
MAERKTASFYLRLIARAFMVSWLIAGSLLYAVAIQSTWQAVVSFVVGLALVSTLIYKSDFFIKRRRTASDVVRDRVSFDMAYGPETYRVQ